MEKPQLEPDHVLVQFGSGIPQAMRGPLLMDMERLIRRATGRYNEIFMDRMDDDSKLRRMMTPEERLKL